MGIAVFTHVEHQLQDGHYYAYAPYVREMNLWLKKFEKVEIVAPLKNGSPESGGLAYESGALNFVEIPSIALISFSSVCRSMIQLPGIFRKVTRTMDEAEHLHLRCPGNIGLVAAICQIFFPGKSKSAKYAGNWDPEAKQPWTYKLQRWILSNTLLTKNMQVLVYGEWPGQSKNVKPFFTASFSDKTIIKVQEKRILEQYIFLFVGNLVPGKGLKIALKAIQEIQQKGVDCRMEIYGEGPERKSAKSYVEEAGISGIEFKGNRSLEELEEAYQRGHFVILPSRSEGWPKAVAEGMFFGCIPVVTPVSCVPWMLGREGSRERREERGILLVERGERKEERVLEENVERILEVLEDRERMQRMSKAAREWSQQYTLEKFEAGIREVLENARKP